RAVEDVVERQRQGVGDRLGGRHRVEEDVLERQVGDEGQLEARLFYARWLLDEWTEVGRTQARRAQALGALPDGACLLCPLWCCSNHALGLSHSKLKWPETGHASTLPTTIGLKMSAGTSISVLNVGETG